MGNPEQPWGRYGAYDSKLLSAVTRIAIDSVLGFYKRRARDDENIKGQSGAVSVVQ